MRIGEVARRLGVDASTLRYYEEVGLLPNPGRTENGYRQYAERDLRRMELVIALRRLDVPLDEVRTLANACLDHGCANGTQQLLAVIDGQTRRLDAQIEDLRSLMHRFAELRQRLSNGGRTTVTRLEPVDTTARRPENPSSSGCDCGCTGGGCGCGCACCGSTSHEDHQSAVEVLAQAPQDACNCGCCD